MFPQIDHQVYLFLTYAMKINELIYFITSFASYEPPPPTGIVIHHKRIKLITGLRHVKWSMVYPVLFTY